MKKLTLIFMILFAFVVSCGADNPTGNNNSMEPPSHKEINFMIGGTTIAYDAKGNATIDKPSSTISAFNSDFTAAAEVAYGMTKGDGSSSIEKVAAKRSDNFEAGSSYTTKFYDTRGEEGPQLVATYTLNINPEATVADFKGTVKGKKAIGGITVGPNSLPRTASFEFNEDASTLTHKFYRVDGDTDEWAPYNLTWLKDLDTVDGTVRAIYKGRQADQDTDTIHMKIEVKDNMLSATAVGMSGPDEAGATEQAAKLIGALIDTE